MTKNKSTKRLITGISLLLQINRKDETNHTIGNNKNISNDDTFENSKTLLPNGSDTIEKNNNDHNPTLSKPLTSSISFSTKNEEEEEHVLKELHDGLALIKNISSFWTLNSKLQKECSYDFQTWNLPTLPYFQIAQKHSTETIKSILNNEPNEMEIENDSELVQICHQLDMYINAILSIPPAIRSDALLTFLSVPDQSNITKTKTHDSSHKTEKQNFLSRKNKDDHQTKRCTNNMTTDPISNHKTCYDYIFGEENMESIPNMEQQEQNNNNNELEDGRFITIPRRGTLSKSFTIPPNHCFLWRFRILSGSTSSIYFRIALESSNNENDSEATSTTPTENPLTEAFSNNDDSNDNTNTHENDGDHTKISKIIIYEEPSCTYQSFDSPPYQGHFHHLENYNDNNNSTSETTVRKIIMTFQNNSSLFRSAQFSSQYTIVPYDTYKAATMAANDQNITSNRRKYAPLLEHIFDSIHCVSLKVVPLFLDDGFTNGRNSNNKCNHNSVDNQISKSKLETNNNKKEDVTKLELMTSIIFEEVLSNTWSKGKGNETRHNIHAPKLLTKSESHDNNNKNKNSHIQTKYPKPFSSEHLKIIIKPYQDQIKSLRRQLYQIASQYACTESQLSKRNKSLNETNRKLRDLREEKKQWNAAQRELEITMKKLMGDLNIQREKDLTTKEWKERVDQLENEKEELKSLLEAEQKKSKNVVEEMKKCFEKERNQWKKSLAQAEMEADDAKMTKAVFEGKVREMERTLKEREIQIQNLNDEQVQTREFGTNHFYKDIAENDISSSNASSVCSLSSSSTLEVPNFITMPYTHPDARLNARLTELRERYDKLFQLLRKGKKAKYDETVNCDEKNEILLQKMGMAIEEIISSGNSKVYRKLV